VANKAQELALREPPKTPLPGTGTATTWLGSTILTSNKSFEEWGSHLGIDTTIDHAPQAKDDMKMKRGVAICDFDAPSPEGSPIPWEPAASIRTVVRGTHVFWLLLTWLTVLPSQVRAQVASDGEEAPHRVMLEAGLVAGNEAACPGRYVAINGRVAGPVSWYGMVETHRCDDETGMSSRVGASVLLGSPDRLVRPSLRAGMEWSTTGTRCCRPAARA
jgi:hypothetical protein